MQSCNPMIKQISAYSTLVLHHSRGAELQPWVLFYFIVPTDSIVYMFHPKLAQTRSSSPMTSHNTKSQLWLHGLWCLIKETVRENKLNIEGVKNNIKPLHQEWGKKVQHCTDPESSVVPKFPQDHLKSSSTNPESSEKTQGFSLMDNALAMCSSGSASLWAGKVHIVLMWLSLAHT